MNFDRHIKLDYEDMIGYSKQTYGYYQFIYIKNIGFNSSCR